MSNIVQLPTVSAPTVTPTTPGPRLSRWKRRLLGWVERISGCRYARPDEVVIPRDYYYRLLQRGIVGARFQEALEKLNRQASLSLSQARELLEAVSQDEKQRLAA